MLTFSTFKKKSRPPSQTMHLLKRVITELLDPDNRSSVIRRHNSILLAAIRRTKIALAEKAALKKG